MAASFGFMTIQAKFEIVDATEAESSIPTFVAKAKAEAGCMYYGFTRDGTALTALEAYVDGAAVLAHIEGVGALLTEFISGPVKLVSLELFGPEAELAKVKKGAPAGLLDNAIFFNTTDAGLTHLKSLTSPEVDPLTICVITPYFTVIDGPGNKEKAAALARELVKVTQKEDGNVYYSYTLSEDGTKLFVREAYVDGDAVNAHLERVSPGLLASFEAGYLKLDSIALHGPAAELEKTKKATEPYGASWHAIQDGFSKFKKLPTPAKGCGFCALS